MKKKDNIKRGFTLVELLATIVIISIVFGIGYSEEARKLQQRALRLTLLILVVVTLVVTQSHLVVHAS